MLRSIKQLSLQLFIAVFILVLCATFLLLIPKSSSWLHREQNMDGNFKIGKIDLWLNGIDDSTTQIEVPANAPTRFFGQPEYRDEHFDVAVKPYEINGLNMGDIDVKVDLSCTDSNSSNYSLYYIFVPGNTADTNFVSGKYRDYLDSLFSGYSLTTPDERKTAMNSINQATLTANKGHVVPKTKNRHLFYMLVWSEYDAINNITSSTYISQSFPITINAHSYQLYSPDT